MRSIIELKNVSKIYQLGKVEVKALNNVSFSIGSSDLISIMGPSGSGKSTLLDIIGLLTKPTLGQVFVDHVPTTEMDNDQMAEIRRKKIGFIFQTFNLIPRLTALENVMLPMWFAGVPDEEKKKRATHLLEIVGLGSRINHRPTEMSGGERQRVAIARALANNPEVILADEPTGNLDSKAGEQVIDILLNLHKNEKRAVVIVTHDPSLARKAKKRIKIKDGKIVKRG
ncbi:MAG: macrolide ABC transporter ATP-binding protein [Candidatus Aenigmarchaeota archaeon ex4484_14]|nr:MAG: macrolide ABC transporter ATP-binding protein [Candidatus Aenigmarchaeota archaeon ex4484_14]